MTYNSILNSLKSEFTKLAGFDPDDASDIGIRLKVMSGEFLSIYNQLDFLSNQIFPQTAVGDYLAKHGANRNIFHHDAKPSSGELVFSRNTSATSNIPIPANTIVACSDNSNLSFATTIDSSIKSGQSSVTVPAKAVQTGADSNIAANKIDTIISSLPGVTSVSNPTPFSGGSVKESDDSFRSRLLDSFINIPSSSNLTFYENLALQHPNITSARAILEPNSNIINIYVSNYDRFIHSSVISEISSIIENFRPLNFSINVLSAQSVFLSCTLTIYSSNSTGQSETISSVTSAVNNYISELAVGQYFSPFAISPRILAIPSVVDYKFSSPNSIVTIKPTQVFSSDSINISFERR